MRSHFYKKEAEYRRIQIIGENKEESEYWEFFYDKLSETEQDRTILWMDQLADTAHLSSDRFTKLNEAIWELKPTKHVRALGFHHDNSFVITHGFYKTTQQVPQREIDKADNYRRRFLSEREGG